MSSNHTSSYSSKNHVRRKLGYDTHNKEDSVKEGYQASGSINVLFIAFGRIFDIVLYPDHKRIPSARKDTDALDLENSESIFYHGHLKGMQYKSDVTLTFHEMELVSLNKVKLLFTFDVKLIR